MIREEECFDNTSCRAGQLMKGKGSLESKIYITVISNKRGKSGERIALGQNKSLELQYGLLRRIPRGHWGYTTIV